jgi:hypothetical protein
MFSVLNVAIIGFYSRNVEIAGLRDVSILGVLVKRHEMRLPIFDFG